MEDYMQLVLDRLVRIICLIMACHKTPLGLNSCPSTLYYGLNTEKAIKPLHTWTNTTFMCVVLLTPLTGYPQVVLIKTWNKEILSRFQNVPTWK